MLEARISHLAYASEIAAAMLQRQQAGAIVAARTKIVDGAVGMVDMALEHLKRDNIVDLDPAQRATLVSNLLVVLVQRSSHSTGRASRCVTCYCPLGKLREQLKDRRGQAEEANGGGDDPQDESDSASFLTLRNRVGDDAASDHGRCNHEEKDCRHRMQQDACQHWKLNFQIRKSRPQDRDCHRERYRHHCPHDRRDHIE